MMQMCFIIMGNTQKMKIPQETCSPFVGIIELAEQLIDGDQAAAAL